MDCRNCENYSGYCVIEIDIDPLEIMDGYCFKFRYRSTPSFQYCEDDIYTKDNYKESEE